jgi:muconolactone delta-isomerase
MKYLVIVRGRDGLPVPSDVVAGMLLAQRDWIRERIDDGTFDVGTRSPRRRVAIVSAGSGNELSQILTSSPIFAIVSIEVQPLADTYPRSRTPRTHCSRRRRPPARADRPERVLPLTGSEKRAAG